MFDVRQPLFDMEGAIGAESGVENVPAAEVQSTPQVEVSESGAGTEVAAEPEKPNNFEKAFAKRLAAEREKWDADIKQKYGDYDDVKQVAEYFRETNNFQDMLSLREQVELERLQQRAEKENLPPEVLRRLDALEAKAARVDEFEEQQQQAQWQQTYFAGLDDFVKDRGVDAKQLNQFMIDNSLQVDPNNLGKSFEIALKAMKYDDVVREKEEAEKNGMKKLIQAKGSIPTVPGSNTQGSVVSAPPKSFAEARQRAMQRLSGE